MIRQKILIGRSDIIDLPEFGLSEIAAKIDTGAYTSAIHCSRIKLTNENGKPVVTFQLTALQVHGKKSMRFSTSAFKRKNIRSSSGHVENRYVIKTKVRLFGRLYSTEFSLTDRSNMKFPVLLGRKLLVKKFLVDVSQVNLSFREKQKKSE
jgi:hypothetical protein